MATKEKAGAAKTKAPKKPVDNSPAAKAARFKTIAGRRTSKILKTLGHLGNCANTNVYGYEEAQVNTIFTAIEKQLAIVRNKFQAKKEKEAAITVTL